MSLATVTEELRLGTDAQTLFRSERYERPASESTPREELVLIMELPDRPDCAEELIATVFGTLKQICFADQTRDPYERFEMALKEANAVIGEFREQQPNKTLGRINAITGFVSGADLHLTQSGDAEAYLIRAGTLTTITEGLSPDPHAVDTFVNIASGALESRDKLVMTSERLLRYATKNELIKIFSPMKQLGLALEELDEIIVLEGAQTTGILALDVSTHATATRSAQVPGSELLGQWADHELVHEGRKQLDRGLAWLRERLPAGTRLPDMPRIPVDKNYLVLGFLVVVIGIILSFSWNLGTKGKQLQAEEIQLVLSTVQEHIDVAKLRRNIGDRNTAYDELTSAELLIQDLVATGVAMEETSVKRQEILAIRDELDNIKRYTELTPTANIAAANAAVSLVGIVDYRGRKIAYDTSDLYDIALDSVTATNSIDSVSAVRAAAYFADRDAIAFMTADGKIIEWRDGEAAMRDTSDPTWKTGVDIATYGTFIYILDPVNNQIWKYNRQRDSYGSAEAYNANADLTKAVSLAIDGDIWVLQNDGDGDMANDIIRIRRGERRALPIKDLPGGSMSEPSVIYTNEKLRYIYVLDRGDNRILRFYKDPPNVGAEHKELVYGTQYRFDTLTDIRDFWVDDNEQKLTIITKDKLYEVTM